jgi:uncharacterized protein YceK
MKLVRLAIVLLPLGSAGCGTYYSQYIYWGGRDPELEMAVIPVWVYGGTLNDINLLFELFGLPLLDLPLSFAADTVLLPLTITEEIRGKPGTRCRGPEYHRQVNPPPKEP